jgi:uncharacterized protein (TIGR02284 family)
MYEKLISDINDQIRLDLDAIGAYDEAVSACNSEDIRAEFAVFRSDHERHVRNLSDMVRIVGGEPATRTDWKGAVVHGFTKLTSRGDRSALYAMRANEELTTRSYRAALEKELPDDVRALFERHMADERRHLEWIKNAIGARAWEGEQPEPPAPPPAP